MVRSVCAEQIFGASIGEERIKKRAIEEKEIADKNRKRWPQLQSSLNIWNTPIKEIWIGGLNQAIQSSNFEECLILVFWSDVHASSQIFRVQLERSRGARRALEGGGRREAPAWRAINTRARVRHASIFPRTLSTRVRQNEQGKEGGKSAIELTSAKSEEGE